MLEWASRFSRYDLRDPDHTGGGAPQPVVEPKKHGIALALGGGAARGFAHVGVIQVLEENGIRPDYVIGTSAGSFVAALYASGKTGAQLGQIAETLEEAAFTDWTLPIFNRGVMRGEALGRYVNQQVGQKLIEQMVLPLGIVATDLQSGNAIVFRRGDTGTAVRASSAVPALFQPVRIGAREYVDGGLVAPVPVRQVRQMGAEFVIAVDISSKANGIDSSTSMLGNINQSIRIMGNKLGALELQRADIVIRPKVNDIGPADFEQKNRAILEGERAAQAALPQIKARLAALQDARQAKAQQTAETLAAQQREAERKARCAQQQGWAKTLTRDADCRAD